MITITIDPVMTTIQNGARLHAALGALVPGDRLTIGPGIWSVEQRLDVSHQATAAAPIFICGADPNNRPVITRSNANQNVINMGSNGEVRYVAFKDLEVTGGGDLMRIYDASNLWIDGCYLHDGGGVGIPVQTHDADHLYITRNEIARPGPGTPGEGMYFGQNSGALIVTDSVIAQNHVHDLRSARAGQGDGIELKQRSHRNWIVDNVVHGSSNPCILVYGTGGNDENVVERNVLYDSDDTPLQVQGEAIVRNNISIGGGNAGFVTFDHQGQSVNLQLIHNTIVSQNRALSIASWNNRPGMVLANNVIYSTGAESIFFGNGSAGVVIEGNVVHGNVVNVSSGFVQGAGLGDFADVNFGTMSIDATPVVGGALDNRGSPNFAVGEDAFQTARELPADPGAVTNAQIMTRDVAMVSATNGGTQNLAFGFTSRWAGANYLVLGAATGTQPGYALGDYWIPLQPDFLFVFTATASNGALLQNTFGTLDGNGAGAAQILVPPTPDIAGLTVHWATTVWQSGTFSFVSNPVSLTFQ